ncbi:FAD-dependent oxidoreductase [Prauserella sp. PE36]|uniref:FAD-dependent monooxygenase n=1 Tax=Prauserella sp. PE36 TaxID=1504709 RepID=UPI000DE4812E|nr:FAD-dependent monooxygenase [Prauserella sp. PE36]RBM10948.1 FAD-dependent oxidoreductase [Prauserella sp. PE36]
MDTAIVIGGGIGGLSAAIALRLAGLRVTVVERAPEFTGIGAGITLWPNAVHALGALGLGDRLAPLLAPQRSGGVHDAKGRPIIRFDGAAFERRFGSPLVGIRRADLIALLRDALPPGALRPGTEVETVSREGRVTFRDGTSEHADLVVGADGIHSRVRAALWPAHSGTVHGGFTAFRALTHDRPDVGLGICWGPGTEFGTIPLAGGVRYWFASFVAGEGTHHTDPKGYVLSRLAGWPAVVRSLVADTDPDAVLHHDLRVQRRRLPTYVAGRVALLGDAAHAMKPFLGQGGCQAIEDAAVLAACVAGNADVGSALTAYDAARGPRTRAIVRASALAGRFGNGLRSPLLGALRNGVLRRMPAAFALRQNEFAAGWRPPAITPGLPRKP